MDLKIFPYKNNCEETIENNLINLGITIISKNIRVEIENSIYYIEILGIDENGHLVVIEFKKGKFSRTINKGLIFVDYLQENISFVKMLLKDKNIIYSGETFKPRLLIIADSFNTYDQEAIKRIPYMIDVCTYKQINKSLVIEKHIQSMHSDNELFSCKMNNNIYIIYQNISEFLLSLGEEVVETGIGNKVWYRRIKTFLTVEYFVDKVEIYAKRQKYVINDLKQLNSLYNIIEEAYDEC